MSFQPLYICYLRELKEEQILTREGLVKSARELYRKWEVPTRKSYNRYFRDFISSLTFPINIDSPPDEQIRLRAHSQLIIQQTLSMLYERQDLVEHFFSLDGFDNDDVKEMLRYFDTEKRIRNRKNEIAPLGECTLTNDQISRLVDVAIGFGVFSHEPSITDIRRLFFCLGESHLQAADTDQKYGVFVCTVADSGCLYYNWQQLLREISKVKSVKGDKFIDRYDGLYARTRATKKYIKLRRAIIDIVGAGTKSDSNL